MQRSTTLMLFCDRGLGMSRTKRLKRLKRASEAVILVLLAVGLAGCASFRAARLYQQGTAALNAGHPEIALELLERAGRLEPGQTQIQNHIGLVFALTGQHEKALSAFQRAVDLDCSNSAAVQNLVAARASVERARAANEMTTSFATELAEVQRDSNSVQAP